MQYRKTEKFIIQDGSDLSAKQVEEEATRLMEELLKQLQTPPSVWARIKYVFTPSSLGR